MQTSSSAPMIGAISTGNLGKSGAWDRLDFRKFYVSNHKSKAVRRVRRSAKRTERRLVRSAIARGDC